MTTFVLSDTHFHHANILKFCPESRPFPDIETMNEALVEAWNSVVGPGDTVYHLGDFSFARSPEVQSEIFNRLNGIKCLIRGNHDYGITVTLGWEFVQHYYELRHRKQTIVLCHYPMESWNRSNHGSIHLHGHIHSSSYRKITHHPIQMLKNRLDVGVDNIGPVPVSLDEILDVYIPNHNIQIEER